MKKCILSANCQGEVFQYLLNKQPEFKENWKLKYYVNFQKTPIPDGEIENCDLLLHQNLSDAWGNLSARALIARAPSHAKIFILPNMVNFHLWPTAKWSPDPMDSWQDSYINSLVDKGLSFSEVIYLVMKTDFTKRYDLPSLMRNSLRREYNKNYLGRDQLFKYIEKHWQYTELFTTPNHPANELLYIVLNCILEQINIPPVPIDAMKLYCDQEFFLPVHPFITKHYNIKYLHENSTFPVYGKALTYKEYLLAYVDARQKQIPLLQYLYDLKK